jgi:hypothetical protein
MKGPRLPKLLEEALEGTDHEIKAGGKHWKIFVNNQFVGIFPMGGTARQSSDLRHAHNTRSNIRRVLKQSA